MLKPKEIINDLYKIEIYEINGYKIAVHYMNEQKVLVINQIKYDPLKPDIRYVNNKGYIDFSDIRINENEYKQLIENIELAIDTIEIIKKHVLL